MWAKMIDILTIFELKVDDICDGSYNYLTFIDIYGSPINRREGIYDQMNYNVEIGLRQNGRIVMLCKVTDTSPIAQVRDIPEEEKN